MLTRRLGLQASALALVAVPALAQKRPPSTPARAGRKGRDAAAPTGSPAETPLGAIDTAARWAYIQDFDTGAALLEKQADDEMPPSGLRPAQARPPETGG
jgi:D-alanyl-D-alanine carboxypeptidase (penicillin-binding protein 5/6)